MMEVTVTVPRMNGPFSHYLGERELAILIQLVRGVNPKIMIEFGCNRGVTAKRVLENVPTLRKYIGIDVPRDFVTVLTCQRTEVPEVAGVGAFDDDRFFLLTIPSEQLHADDLEPCDAVFIDGDHSEAGVLHDSRLAYELVRPGGIIVWHDYNNPGVPVTRALENLADEGWQISTVKDSWLAFMRR